MPLFGAPNVANLQAKGKVKALLDAISYKKDPQVRRHAVVALGVLAAGQAVEPLVAVLQGREFRLEAATSLGQIGDVRAVDALLVALHDAEAPVRVAAARSLGQIGDGRASQALMEAFGDRDAAVREAVVAALTVMGAETEALLVRALRDPAKVIHESALAALTARSWKPTDDEAGATYWILKGAWDEAVKLGPPAVVPLVEALQHPERREEAAKALGTLKDGCAAAPLAEALSDERAAVRRAIVEALTAIGASEGLPALIVALQDEDEKVRRSAAEGLAKNPEASAADALIAAVGDTSPDVRLAAVEGLGKIGVAAAIPAVVAGLRDEHTRVITAAEGAVRLLATLHREQVISALREVILDANTYLRGRVTRILDQLGWQPSADAAGAAHAIQLRRWDDVRPTGAAGLPALIPILSDVVLRPRLVECLISIGEPAVEPLLQVLREGRVEARPAAAEALGQIGDACAVEVLIAGLPEAFAPLPEDLPLSVPRQRAQEAWRKATITALGELGAAAVPGLVAVLRQADQQPEAVTEAAAQALANAGAPAVAPLTELLGDPALSGIAQQALVQAGPDSVQPLLDVLLAAGSSADAACETLSLLEGEGLERLCARAAELAGGGEQIELLWQVALRVEDAERFVALATALQGSGPMPQEGEGDLYLRLLDHEGDCRAAARLEAEALPPAEEGALSRAMVASALLDEAAADAENEARRYRQCLRLAPRFSSAYVALASHYRCAAQPGRALGWATQALALIEEDLDVDAASESGERDDPHAWVELGLARGDMGDPLGATAAFLAALLVDAELADPAPYLYLMEIYARLGMLPEMYAMRDRALALGAVMDRDRSPEWRTSVNQVEVTALRDLLESARDA